MACHSGPTSGRSLRSRQVEREGGKGEKREEAFMEVFSRRNEQSKVSLLHTLMFELFKYPSLSEIQLQGV